MHCTINIFHEMSIKTFTIHKQPLTKNAVIVTAAVGCDGANTFTAKGVVTATTAATALGTFFVSSQKG